jgi:hypothetical protein
MLRLFPSISRCHITVLLGASSAPPCAPAWAAGEKSAYEHDREYFPQKRRETRRKAAEAAAERDDPEAGG